MKAPGLPADQQFFADLFSGLVLNPQLLGRVWFASQPASLPVGSLCIDFPRLDIVLRGEYGNLLEAKQQRLVEGEMLFIPARAANLPVNNKPVMLLSRCSLRPLGLSFYDSRTTSLLHPARQIQLPSLQRGEGEAMLTALTHLSRSPLEQNIIQPLVLSLLHLCRSVVNMPPGIPQPRGDFSYHSICNWVQDNYAQPLTRESVAQFFISRPIICQNCCSAWNDAFYRVCALGANGEGEDDFAEISSVNS